MEFKIEWLAGAPFTFQKLSEKTYFVLIRTKRGPYKKKIVFKNDYVQITSITTLRKQPLGIFIRFKKEPQTNSYDPSLFYFYCSFEKANAPVSKLKQRYKDETLQVFSPYKTQAYLLFIIHSSKSNKINAVLDTGASK